MRRFQRSHAIWPFRDANPPTGTGWRCEARIRGVDYEVWLVVIRTDDSKPDTWGVVRQAGISDRSLWEERVPASVGPRDILSLAGLTS